MTSGPLSQAGAQWAYATLDLVPDAVAISNTADQRIEYANSAAAELLGYEQADLIGMPLTLLNPDVDEATRRRLQQEIALGGRSTPVHARVVDIHGEPIPCEVHVRAVTGADGVPRIINVLRDERGRLAAERSRREGEESFRAAFDQAPIGMALLRVDELGRRTILKANEALGQVLAVPAPRLAGMGLDDFLPPKDVETARQDARDVIAGRSEIFRRMRYRRPTGTDVWVDQRMTLTTLPDPFGLVALAHLHDVTEQERQALRSRREATMTAQLARVVTSLLAGARPEDTYSDLAAAAAQVTDAPESTLCLPEPRAGRTTRVATFGPVAASLQAEEAPFSPTLLDAMSRGGPAIAFACPPQDAHPAARETLGPIAVVQVRADPRTPGFLSVARTAGADPFTEDELELLGRFAHQISLVIQLARAREDQGRLALLNDRQRIARDLHDTVIQDLIALGMQLTAFGRRTGTTSATNEFVQQLEVSIRRLRQAIFTLRDDSASGSLHSTLRELVTDATATLGHQPRVAVDGPDRLPLLVLDQLRFVVREALSNIARHADATSTTVAVHVHEGALRLVVEDNGHGPSDTDAPGDGLRNLEYRARALGGTAQLRRLPSGGCQLTWTCRADPAGRPPAPEPGR